MVKFNTKIILTFFFLFILILLLTSPALTLSYAGNGLSIWYKNMVPALFPMMIITGCMIKLNITTSFVTVLHPVIKHLFHLTKNGTYALLIGFLCGFPMGAKVICTLYRSRFYVNLRVKILSQGKILSDSFIILHNPTGICIFYTTKKNFYGKQQLF